MSIKQLWDGILGRYSVRCPREFEGYFFTAADGKLMAEAIRAAAPLFGAWDPSTHEFLYKALVTQLEAIAG